MRDLPTMPRSLRPLAAKTNKRLENACPITSAARRKNFQGAWNGKAMKAFVWLFALLIMASAAPTMACVIALEENVSEKYQELVRKFADETAQELGAQDTPDARLKLAEALFAHSIRTDGRRCHRSPIGEQIALYDEIERRFGDDKSPKMRAMVLKALIAKTEIAFSNSKYVPKYVPEGTDASSLIRRRYATDNDPEIQALYAGALVSWAEREYRFHPLPLPDKKRKQAISLYNEIFARYQDSKNPGVRAAVAKALSNQAWLMREEEKPAKYDEIIQRFGKDDLPAVREEVIMALLAKGDVLQKLGKYGEVASHYDNSMRLPWLKNEWVQSPRTSSYEGFLRSPLLAVILEEKGWALEKQGKLIHALAAYDQAIAVYDDARYQERKIEGEYLYMICRVLIAKAAILRKQKGEQAANAVYENIARRIEKTKNSLDKARYSVESFYRDWYLRMCESTSYTRDADAALAACVYVFQRIGLDNKFIQNDLQHVIKRKAQQKP